MAADIHRIHIAHGEHAGAEPRLTDAHLAEAVEALERDGIVMLHNAIPPRVVEKLAAKMLADFQQVAKRRPLNSKYLAPPRNHPWLLKEILYNPFALQVLGEMLGPGFYWDNYAQNAVEPFAEGQQSKQV